MNGYLTFLGIFSILIWPVAFIVALIIKLFQVPKMAREMYPGVDAIMESRIVEETDSAYPEEDEETEHEVIGEDDIEELPFCQLFNIGKDMCLFIDHVEMCPDETAFIRVVSDDGYTPLYKRKVRRNKRNDRFIVFNDVKYYLDDKKTQPTVPKK